MTSEHSKEPSLEQLTLSQEVFPVSRFLSLGSEGARTILATSGRQCTGLLTRRDRVSSWLRTLLASSTWHSTVYLLTWKASGTPQGRLLFRLVPSTRFTDEIASGYSHIETTPTKEVTLTTGETVLVDAEDFDFLNQWRWKLHKEGYAYRNQRGPNLYMHRVIAGAEKGGEVDHINRNKLDNRKENLRIVSHSVNTHNRTDAAGYYKPTGRNKWRARIYVNNETVSLGSFDTEEDAKAAYQEAKIRYGLIPPPAVPASIKPWPTPDTQNHRDGTKRRKEADLNPDSRHAVSLHHAIAQEPWPTPRSGNCYRDTKPSPSSIAGTHGWSTAGAVIDSMSENPNRNWPTPRAWATPTVNSNHNYKGCSPTSGDGLATQVKAWPTPDTQNHRDGSYRRKDSNLEQGGRHGVSLHHAVWGTPRSNEWKGCGDHTTATAQEWDDKHYLSGQIAMSEQAQGSKLHGRWTLALMNYPPDWCDLGEE